MKIIAAPLQGYTEAPWRRFHAEVYGSGVDTYCAPFVRAEHGLIRPRDLRDTTSPTPEATAQIICRDAEEFRLLADALTRESITRIDLNLGCPFPPQVKHGRGAGLAADPERLAGVLSAMADYPGVCFSAKMRLDHWQINLPLLENSPVRSLTVHARLHTQQYSGDCRLEEFAAIAEATRLPLTYNGNILSPADFNLIADRFPFLEGIMIGRGLLARPSLAAEIKDARQWSAADRMDAIFRLHDKLLAHFETTLCGPAQILSKIKPYWDYLEPEIGHKSAKQIRKSTTLPAYCAALRAIPTISGAEMRKIDGF